MRLSISIVLLTCGGCLSTSISGQGDGGSSGGSTAGASSSGAVSTSGGGTGSTSGGASTSGSAATTGGSTNGGVLLPAGPCGPGTAWLGDSCVVTNCSYPVSATAPARCELPDGGLGYCSAGTCLVADDSQNCGDLGVVCPPPAQCYQSSCSTFSDAGFSGPYDCAQDGCPSSNETCANGASCLIASCADAGDDLACVVDGGALGFCCGGACVLGAPGNCGGCGILCPQGTGCAGNVCAPVSFCGAAGSAPYGGCLLPSGARGFCCGSECLDSNDSTSCGICGLACGESLCGQGTCEGSVCGPTYGCPAGYGCAMGVDGQVECFPASCSGAPESSACLVPDAGVMGTCRAGVCEAIADSARCGLTGTACEPGEFCFEGRFCQPLLDCSQGGGYFPESACRTDAGTLGSCCGPLCIDTTSDSQNCYICGLGCPLGSSCQDVEGFPRCFNDAGQAQCASSADCPAGDSCVYGSCLSPSCDQGQEYCNFDGGSGECCGVSCVAQGIDCGGSCPTGSVKSSSNFGCSAPDGGLACFKGAVCPAGTLCDPASQDCIPLDSCSAFPNSNCPFGISEFAPGSCCGSVCTDPTQDPENCFGCGVVCASGICLAAPFGSNVGGCLPAGPAADCSVSCATGMVCLDGQCIDGSCENSNFCLAENGTIGVCCGDGTCAHPLDDPLNCGVCGNACGAGGTCVNGSCANFPGCGLGRMSAFCNLDAGTDFVCCPSVGCTDSQTDAHNCGYCGSQCVPGLACVDGSCQVP